MFSAERRTITIDGQDVVLVELSAHDFAEVMAAEDDKQGLEMLVRSIESPKVTIEEVSKWPNRIVNQLLSSVMDLNGLTEQGN